MQDSSYRRRFCGSEKPFHKSPGRGSRREIKTQPRNPISVEGFWLAQAFAAGDLLAFLLRYAEDYGRNYKGHKIRASTWQLAESGHWEPRVFVTWREGSNEKTKPLVFTRAFSTERDAEAEGLQLAKIWIDDGKPELKVGPT
jgi:hypothetical protein